MKEQIHLRLECPEGEYIFGKFSFLGEPTVKSPWSCRLAMLLSNYIFTLGKDRQIKNNALYFNQSKTYRWFTHGVENSASRRKLAK